MDEINIIKIGGNKMNKEIKVDVRDSVINGFSDYKHMTEFFMDIRELMIKHDVTLILSECIKMGEDNKLIVRNSNFESNKVRLEGVNIDHTNVIR